jgi:rhodanese-related sulfurtransferase
MMKNLKEIFVLVLLAVIIIALISCIEDNISPPLTGDLNPAAELLYYFESQGDFANGNLAPGLIEPEEVFSNLNNYLLVDIRPESDFVIGHIENAVNVQTDSLFEFVEANYDSGFQKIIIICKNGFSTAYFTCLLRLADFDNVYSMDFGMASWNELFADEWLNSLSDYYGIFSWSNTPFPKNEFTALPELTFTNPGDPLDKRVKSRIKEIFDQGFKYGLNYYQTLPNFINKYPICYGKSYLYNARRDGVLAELGHPDDTRSYLDANQYEFRSSKFLQTLPTSTEIFLYDYNGQLAACMTAYLRVLGYDVRMLLFGANQLFYSRMVDDPELNGFIFSSQKIRNYPFVSGE